MTDGLPRKRIVGYADRMSARPGEAIRFMASCEDVPSYRADLVRLISGDHHPDGCGFIERVVPSVLGTTHRGRRQIIHAGSFATIDDPAPFAALTSFTLQAMIWPTIRLPVRPQSILGSYSKERRAGFALMIHKGSATLRIGNGTQVASVRSGVPLPDRVWTFVAASFDAATRTARIIQATMPSHARAPEPIEREAHFEIEPAPSHTPFSIAADIVRTRSGRIASRHNFNGKIDRPRVANRALDHAEMEEIKGAGPYPPHVVAAWDFALDMTTDRVHDRSANRLEGRLVNMPTRAMKGWTWTGEEMNWTHAPEQYGAIHFHDDDLYDAGWQTDFSFDIPDDLPSGVYAARLAPVLAPSPGGGGGG
ncbi:MAG: N,N-dimethylformamidase beta subunit family domain-containing protein, partial [Alphaproteobacteria bacterium]